MAVLRSLDMTVRDLVAQRAGATPGGVFVDAVDGALTFREFAAETDRWARGLTELGLAKGDRVCVLATNRLATPLAWVATTVAGGIQVPLNVHHKATMHRHVLDDARPRLLVVEPALAGNLPRELPDCVEGVVPLGEGTLPAGWPVRPLPVAATATLPALHYADPAGIQYTSGTTGPTKGALSSHRFMVNFARVMADMCRIDERDVLFNPFPQFHSSGQVLGVLLSLVSGARLVMDEKFSLRGFFPRVRETSATVGFALGGMLSLIESLEPGPGDTDHDLRLVYSTPAPRDQVLRMERRFGFRVRQNYGSTEQGIVAFQDYDAPCLGAAGQPAPHVDLVVADDWDEPLPAGEVGQILVRPSVPFTIFTGYWERPGTTAEATRNLWFHTGDLGLLDEAGNLFFVDRIADVIRRKGEFVSAAELESLVVEHPSVKEAAAVAVPADVGGQEILVLLVAQPGSEVDHDDLMRFCEERMAYFMVPRYLEVVDELPKTMNGKVRKSVLRERGIGPGAWDRDQASAVRQ